MIPTDGQAETPNERTCHQRTLAASVRRSARTARNSYPSLAPRYWQAWSTAWRIIGVARRIDRLTR
jgi:hypothetical protein